MPVRDLMLGDAPAKRLVSHALLRDVTEGYATDWTLEQLRDRSQRIADRMEAVESTRDERSGAQ